MPDDGVKMTRLEYLLIVLGEEGAEVAQDTAKALRFGLGDFKPGQTEDNKRRLEREVAEVVAVAEMLGLTIRQEDIAAKKLKVEKFMSYSRNIGTLEVRGVCQRCQQPVPPGFLACNGDGSHPAVRRVDHCYVGHCNYVVDRTCICLCARCKEAKEADR
jgi:hypothetical protein